MSPTTNYWVPMSLKSEEPPKEELLLLHFGSSQIETGYLDESGWRFCNGEPVLETILHWADFSAPPRKEVK